MFKKVNKCSLNLRDLIGVASPHTLPAPGALAGLGEEPDRPGFCLRQVGLDPLVGSPPQLNPKLCVSLPELSDLPLQLPGRWTHSVKSNLDYIGRLPR